MSEQQSQTATAVQATTTSACPHPEVVGQRWGDPISEERRAELQRYLDRWASETGHGERKGPFDTGPGDLGFRGVPLTGADVDWLERQSWGNQPGRRPSNLHLEGANLGQAHLERIILTEEAHLEGADLIGAHLEHGFLAKVNLKGANLGHAYLEEVFLPWAHLEGANLRAAHLEGADLTEAHLEGADLRNAWMDKASVLNNAALDRASLDQLSFDGANLAVVKWEAVKLLGDEVRARATKDDKGKRKDRQRRLDEYEAAVRAHLQLAAVLRSQGMSEQADRFTYRAQRLQRTRYRLQRRFGQWLFSCALFLLAGYGYRIGRILLAYILVVSVFAAGYYATGLLDLPHVHPLAWNEALVLSLTTIHGRVFTNPFDLDSIQAWLGAAEAVFGIVIEGVFVAMLIQRFFGR